MTPNSPDIMGYDGNPVLSVRFPHWAYEALRALAPEDTLDKNLGVKGGKAEVVREAVCAWLQSEHNVIPYPDPPRAARLEPKKRGPYKPRAPKYAKTPKDSAPKPAAKKSRKTG